MAITAIVIGTAAAVAGTAYSAVSSADAADEQRNAAATQRADQLKLQTDAKDKQKAYETQQAQLAASNRERAVRASTAGATPQQGVSTNALGSVGSANTHSGTLLGL